MKHKNLFIFFCVCALLGCGGDETPECQLGASCDQVSLDA